MSDPLEDKLKKFGERARKGLEKLYPVTQKHLTDARKIVEEQWKAQQQEKAKSPSQDPAESQNKTKTQEQTKQQKPSQTKSKDQGQSHEH